MNIGLIVFAYNRDWHLQKVLNGIRKNEEIEEIYIFQDGLKLEEHRDGWERTKKVIEDITWCKVKYELAKKNKGLAKSIVEGINKVFETKDCVIVLEDDCVPTANFYNFMQQCFEKYKSEKQIYTVGGYSWPIGMKKDESDIYFCGRISSWGWGTWKDRWEEYSQDGEILRRLKSQKISSKNLALWGNDTEAMFIDRITNQNDSWAIYWALHVIEKNGLCVVPYHSLISNIGFDGSGVHCGIVEKIDIVMERNEQKRQFIFPPKIEAKQSIKTAFASLHGNFTACNENIENENIYVFGIGRFFKQFEKEINQKYYIKGFVDNWKKGYYAGKDIYRKNILQIDSESPILIMIQNIQQSINTIKDLIYNYGIDYKRVMFGNSMFGNYSEIFDKIEISNEGKIILWKDQARIEIDSEEEFCNVVDTFFNEKYNYCINNNKKDIILNLGVGVGETVLYFLDNPKVRKVYAFDSCKEKFAAANKNIIKSVKNNSSYEILCTETSKWDKRVKKIISMHQEENIVLKIDIKEDVRELIQNFGKNKILDKVNLIMLECCKDDKENLLGILSAANYSYCYKNINKDRAFIYAYRGI